MAIVKGNTVLGIFEDQGHARAAMDALHRAGFRDDQLGLAARAWVAEAPETAQVELQKDAGEGAVTGAAVGGGLGAVAGAAAVSLIPGAGPVLAGGLLVGALGGAALGAAAGAFMGPFVALGLSEADAQQYAQHVEAGRTVVVVRTDDRQDEAAALLDRHGAYDDSMRVKPE
jgi:hypothetical protein